jgi:hypothetical protein
LEAAGETDATFAAAAAAAAATAADSGATTGVDERADNHPDVMAAKAAAAAKARGIFRYVLRVTDAIDAAFGMEANADNDNSAADLSVATRGGGGGGGGAHTGVSNVGGVLSAVGSGAGAAARELLHGGHVDGSAAAADSACDAPAASLVLVLKRVPLFAGLTHAEVRRVVAAGVMTGLFVNSDIIARQQEHSPQSQRSGARAGGRGGNSTAAAAAAVNPFLGGAPGRLPRFSAASGASSGGDGTGGGAGGGGGGGSGGSGGAPSGGGGGGGGGGWVDDDCMVVVLSGMAAVVAARPVAAARWMAAGTAHMAGGRHGRTMSMAAATLRELSAGDWFGELSALTGRPRGATAVARTAAVAVAVIPRSVGPDSHCSPRNRISFTLRHEDTRVNYALHDVASNKCQALALGLARGADAPTYGRGRCRRRHAPRPRGHHHARLGRHGRAHRRHPAPYHRRPPHGPRGGYIHARRVEYQRCGQ